MELEHKDITEQVIGASFEVFRELGYGFLEKVYQRAMKVELELRGLTAAIETDIQVRYKGQVVGDYRADILVNGCVLVELKVSPAIDNRDEAQLLNELKATGIKVGLLINFGKNKAEFKRLVFWFFPCSFRVIPWRRIHESHQAENLRTAGSPGFHPGDGCHPVHGTARLLGTRLPSSYFATE